MYWFINSNRLKFLTAVILFTAVTLSCNSRNTSQQNNLSNIKHFDIPNYMQNEIDSLQNLNPLIHKTVIKDTVEETRSLHIKNWDTEFSSFKSIDLNKPAYSEYIKVDTIENVLEYSFENADLDLSCVRISLDQDGNPHMISIQKKIKNNLYKTSELLVYEKSKFYMVEKDQDVKVMGQNYYKVLGQF